MAPSPPRIRYWISPCGKLGSEPDKLQVHAKDKHVLTGRPCSNAAYVHSCGVVVGVGGLVTVSVVVGGYKSAKRAKYFENFMLYIHCYKRHCY